MRLIRAVIDSRHVAHEHRLAVTGISADGNDQLPDIRRGLQIGAGLHQHLSVAGDQTARGLQGIANLECRRKIPRRHAEGVHPLAVHDDTDDMVRTAQSRYVARPLDAFELDFGSARDLLQIECRALGIRRPEGQRDDRHVVDSFWLDDWLQHAQIGRQPVAVGMNGVVKAQDRIVVLDANVELHGDDRHAGAGNRIDVLDARHARQHLFGRRRNEVFDVLCRRSGERHDDIGHGDIDLRLFLTRRDQRGEDAHQQRHQRQQRRHLRSLEKAGDATGNAHHLLPGCGC